MTQPFYVSPEQLMKDRADFARKGISRGRSVVVLGYTGGLLFATENPSRALHKISEIYDRIGFAAVGKYNEFENLRVAGVRYADLRGYSYDRADVTVRGLANAYAQTLGAVFTTESKPLEVEIAVAEVGMRQETDQIYRLSYDGAVSDENNFVVMGGAADHLAGHLKTAWRPGLNLSQAATLALSTLGMTEGEAPREIPAEQIEAAVLDRARSRRAFRRLRAEDLTELLNEHDELNENEAPESTQTDSTEPPEKAADE